MSDLSKRMVRPMARATVGVVRLRWCQPSGGMIPLRFSTMASSTNRGFRRADCQRSSGRVSCQHALLRWREMSLFYSSSTTPNAPIAPSGAPDGPGSAPVDSDHKAEQQGTSWKGSMVWVALGALTIYVGTLQYARLSPPFQSWLREHMPYGFWFFEDQKKGEVQEKPRKKSVPHDLDISLPEAKEYLKSDVVASSRLQEAQGEAHIPLADNRIDSVPESDALMSKEELTMTDAFHVMKTIGVESDGEYSMMQSDAEPTEGYSGLSSLGESIPPALPATPAHEHDYHGPVEATEEGVQVAANTLTALVPPALTISLVSLRKAIDQCEDLDSSEKKIWMEYLESLSTRMNIAFQMASMSELSAIFEDWSKNIERILSTLTERGKMKLAEADIAREAAVREAREHFRQVYSEKTRSLVARERSERRAYLDTMGRRVNFLEQRLLESLERLQIQRQFLRAQHDAQRLQILAENVFATSHSVSDRMSPSVEAAPFNAVFRDLYEPGEDELGGQRRYASWFTSMWNSWREYRRRPLWVQRLSYLANGDAILVEEDKGDDDFGNDDMSHATLTPRWSSSNVPPMVMNLLMSIRKDMSVRNQQDDLVDLLFINLHRLLDEAFQAKTSRSCSGGQRNADHLLQRFSKVCHRIRRVQFVPDPRHSEEEALTASDGNFSTTISYQPGLWSFAASHLLSFFAAKPRLLCSSLSSRHASPPETANDVEWVLSNAEVALKQRDVAMAVLYMESLQGWPRRLANDWITIAKRQAELDQVLRIVKTKLDLWMIQEGSSL